MLISLVVVVIVAVLLLWFVQTYAPVSPPLRQIFSALIVLLVVVWALSAIGLLPPLSHVRARC